MLILRKMNVYTYIHTYVHTYIHKYIHTQKDSAYHPIQYSSVQGDLILGQVTRPYMPARLGQTDDGILQQLARPIEVPVCMYVCMHVCIYVYVHVNVCMYLK